MKSGLKTIAVAFMLLPFAATAQDMQGKTPQERAQQQTQMMQKKLNLTADQATSVGAINMSIATSMDSLTKSSKDRQATGNARKQLMMNRDAQLQSVLTADQFKQYQAMEEERRQKMMQRRQEMQGSGGQMDNGGN